MRALLFLSALALLLAGCGGRPQDPLARTSGTLAARLVPRPDPPRVGHDNGFDVLLTENGRPVRGAQVEIGLFFTPLNQEGPRAPCIEGEPGTYQANELSTPMNGLWRADVKVSRAGMPDAAFTFNFRVVR